MKKDNKHINLNTHLSEQELLEYNNGVLGNNEMYRLELHLNECALCSDALEGIAYIKNSNEILRAVKNEILPKEKKVIKINYMAIAASVTLIAVFGLTYWLLTNTSNKQNLAENTPSEKEVIEPPTEDVKGFSAINEEPEEVTNEIVIAEPAKNESPIANISSIQKDAPKLKTDDAQKFKIANRAQEEQDNEDVALGAMTEIAKEEEADVEEEISIAPSINQEITQQSAPNAARSAKKSISARIVKQDQKNPTPKGGMDVLKNYIEQNRVYPKQAIDNKVKGTVILEVTVSPDGTLKNIVVIKSIGYGCDVEATRLISDGPKWTAKVENGVAIEAKRQVKVKFKN